MSQSVALLGNQEQMLQSITRFFEIAKSEVLAFLSSYTLVLTTDMESIQAPKRAARARGVKLRYITEITKENLSFCKRQIGMVDELRHLDGIKGNFILSDSEFVASPEISKEYPLTEGIYSNMGMILREERNVFETLWSHAIPAQVRFEQLEGGLTIASDGMRPAEEKGTALNKKRVIDRIYVCDNCRSFFLYQEDAQEHKERTGHQRTREFPFFDF
jgi:hypothetical protein